MSTFDYKVVSGDDFTKIAAKVNLTASILQNLPGNKGINANDMQIGSIVKIPITVVTIKKGDTVDNIGKKNSPPVQAAQVAVVNPAGTNLNNIQIDQKINFPTNK